MTRMTRSLSLFVITVLHAKLRRPRSKSHGISVLMFNATFNIYV